MDLALLSTRALHDEVYWQPILEWEDLIVRLCGARLLAPRRRRLPGRPWRRTPLPPPGAGPRVLLVVARTPDELEMLAALPGWRSAFDLAAAFVADAWRLSSFPRLTGQLDHLFVPVLEAVQPIARQHAVRTSLIPFAADALRQGGGGAGPRPIDVLSYGRQPWSFLRAFGRAAVNPDTPIRFRDGIPLPAVPDYRLQRATFWHTLRQARLSLCFDTRLPDARGRPLDVSFLTPRWFEAMAAGAVPLGHRPATALATRLFDWPDALVDLPPDPEHAVPFTLELLRDGQRLEGIRLRNRHHVLARHDWRHRLSELLELLGLPLPAPLQAELAELAQATAAPEAPAA